MSGSLSDRDSNPHLTGSISLLYPGPESLILHYSMQGFVRFLLPVLNPKIKNASSRGRGVQGAKWVQGQALGPNGWGLNPAPLLAHSVAVVQLLNISAPLFSCLCTGRKPLIRLPERWAD